MTGSRTMFRRLVIGWVSAARPAIRHWLTPILMLHALLPLSFAKAADTGPVSFREQVAPILVKSCLGCHNDKKAENGLNMTTFSLLKKGGKSSGASVIVPGEPDESELIISVRADAEPRMPL